MINWKVKSATCGRFQRVRQQALGGGRWVHPGCSRAGRSGYSRRQKPRPLQTPFPEAVALQTLKIKNNVLVCRCLPQVLRSCVTEGVCGCWVSLVWNRQEDCSQWFPSQEISGSSAQSISLSDSFMITVWTFQTTPYSANFSLFFKFSSLANYVTDNILGCYCFIIKIISLRWDP